MNVVTRGIVIGLLATGPMSLVIVLGKQLGLLQTPPPVQITHNIEVEADIRDDLDQKVFNASWLIAHFGYGAACGLLFSLLAKRFSPSSLLGLAFGGLVWAGSYIKLMPALRIYPRPEHDSRSRMGVMIAAHIVFGLSLSKFERWMRGG